MNEAGKEKAGFARIARIARFQIRNFESYRSRGSTRHFTADGFKFGSSLT